jgi:hypothetical protein
MMASIAISDELRANVALRLRARPHDPVADAFESGSATARCARRYYSTGTQPGLFKQAKPQRAPDKQAAYERRHRLAYSGAMPPHLAGQFTPAEMAVFRIVADEVRARGKCAISMAEIGARSGTCRKTAQRALHHAKAEELLRIEERKIKGKSRNLTNVVQIISNDWAAWIDRGAKPRCVRLCSGATVGQESRTTDTSRFKKNGCANDAAVCGTAVQTNKPKRKPEVSNEAKELAAGINMIAGYYSRPRPDSWCMSHVRHVAQMWLNRLDGVSDAAALIRDTVQGVMRRKRQKCPPYSIKYFEREIDGLIARVRYPHVLDLRAEEVKILGLKRSAVPCDVEAGTVRD